MLKNSHDADAAMLSELPLATSFVTAIFLGRGEYARHESADLVKARATADQMAAHYHNGRKALVYAQLPSGRQFLVPDSYQPTEDTMTTKTFNKRFNAQRAAKSALGKDAEEGKEFTTMKNGDGLWEWIRNGGLDDAPNAMAFDGDGNTIAMATIAGPAFLHDNGVVSDMPQAPELSAPPQIDVTPPDFSAKTHTRYRPKLAAVVAMVEARDIDGLRKFHINPSSTSPRAIMRYRDKALAALTV